MYQSALSARRRVALFVGAAPGSLTRSTKYRSAAQAGKARVREGKDLGS